ncbi:MAG: hypothetical protein AVDCRST_MAG76-2028, partial [uncultured Acidimicrobiales bacterium]
DDDVAGGVGAVPRLGARLAGQCQCRRPGRRHIGGGRLLPLGPLGPPGPAGGSGLGPGGRLWPRHGVGPSAPSAAAAPL